MHELQAINPLGGTEARVEVISGLKISENPDMALASVTARSGQEKKLRAAAAKFLGVDLPDVAGIAGKGAVAAFWTGPDQWFFEAPFTSHEDLAARLKAALKGSASVTEQTDGWARFEVAGARCADVFERLSSLDIRAMEAGTASRTAIEHLGCFVLCREKGRRFSVLGPRSSARSLFHALVVAAKAAI